MKTTEIKCDACGDDLMTRGPRPEYRLSLVAEPIMNSTGIEAMVLIQPPLTFEHHFCGMKCLRKWMDDEQAKEDERRAKRPSYRIVSGFGTVPEECPSS